MIEYQVQNSSSFDVVKERISSGIYIRLSGLPEGYKFIEKNKPNWLDEEY